MAYFCLLVVFRRMYSTAVSNSRYILEVYRGRACLIHSWLLFGFYYLKELTEGGVVFHGRLSILSTLSLQDFVWLIVSLVQKTTFEIPSSLLPITINVHNFLLKMNSENECENWIPQ